MKAAILFLVLLVAAFAYFTLRRPPEHQPDWIASLGVWLKPKFDLRDVRPGCLDAAQHVFRAPPPCVAHIIASQDKYRMLSMKLVTAGPVDISFRPAEGDDSGLPFHPVTLKAGKDRTTVVVPKVGGDLTINCAPNQVCAVQVE